MDKVSQPDTDRFKTDARCLNHALFYGDLNQAFSILADIMITSGQPLTSEQVAEYYKRGLFGPFPLPDPDHG